MGRKRKEIAMACDAEGELDMKSNVHFLHIPFSHSIQSDILKWSLPEEVLSVLLKDRTMGWVLNCETGMPIEFRSITEKGGGHG
jgi:hypothetical protein